MILTRSSSAASPSTSTSLPPPAPPAKSLPVTPWLPWVARIRGVLAALGGETVRNLKRYFLLVCGKFMLRHNFTKGGDWR